MMLGKEVDVNKKYEIIFDPVFGYKRLDPLPTQSEIEEYYKKEFYASYNNFNDSDLSVQQKEKDFFDLRWERTLEVSKDFFGSYKGKSLFDIGFGFAQALLYFRDKGLSVSGIEPSREGVEYAKKNDLDVFQGEIEDFSNIKRTFDIVTLINVLEHLREPSSILKAIKNKLLNPGGLLIIDVPNEFNDFQIAADREFSLNKWWIAAPAHINYFSPETLNNLLKNCGFNIFRTESSFPMEMFLLMGDNYVKNPDVGKTCHQKRVNFEKNLIKNGKKEQLYNFYNMLASLNLGRQVITYATC